jgi:hypothetical protein
MESQATVRACFPGAEASFHDGDAAAELIYNRFPRWYVFQGPGRGSRILGLAASAAGAMRRRPCVGKGRPR